MTYYIHIEDNTIIGSGEVPMGDGFESLEVSEELYNDFITHPDKYIYNGFDVYNIFMQENDQNVISIINRKVLDYKS